MPRKFDVDVSYRFTRTVAVVADDEKQAKEKACQLAQGWGAVDTVAKIAHRETEGEKIG